MRNSYTLSAWLLTSATIVAGCGSETQGTGGSAGSAGSPTTTTTTGTGGTAGDTGGGGTGAGSAVCTPGEEKYCYTGPEGTAGVGLCKSGTETCKANVDGFGPCLGEVVPSDEVCATAGDDDCDGKTNEEGADCSCVPGSTLECYSGPPETKDVGPCLGGVQVCNENGMGYGECVGEVLPAAETCDTVEDDDCDGKVNEEGPSCVCPGGEMVACYTGPAGTENVGECKGGFAQCADDGKSLGPCLGQVIPATETCNSAGDEDCDGMSNEEGPGCVCTPGTMVPCYTGPSGTMGVGQCKSGMQQCNAQGMPEGACLGEVTPGVETCNTPADDDCDGQVNEDGVGCTCLPGSTKACYTGPVGTQGVGACKAGSQTCAPDGLSYGPCMGEVLPMAENCNTPANEDCTMIVDCGSQYWAKSFGAVGDQQGYAITHDAQNNAIFTGRFTGFMSFGGNMLVSPAGYDIFLTKFDTNGNHQWSKRFGDANIYQEGFDVAVDSAGNVFLTGYFDGSINFGGAGFMSGGLTDIFLAKFDAAGNHLWSKSFSAPSPQYGASLAVDSMGNVVLLANGFNTIDFGGGGLTSAGNYDIYVAKFDGVTGNHLWSKRYGSPNDDRGMSIAVDSANNIVWVGRSDGALDFGGGSVPGNGALDALVVKLDPNGTLVWSKRFGDGANQFAQDVVLDSSNNVILTGGFEGTINLGGGGLSAAGAIDVYVGKLTSAGNHVWSKRYGAAGANPVLLGLGVDSSGDVTGVGALEGSIDFGAGALTSNGGADALMLHLSGANGNLLWNRLYGGATPQYLSSVSPDSQKNLLVTGYFEGTMDFGGGPLVSLGNLDIVLAKLAP
ncbi:MAG: SBBP repeat-containing protein [Polyangiaceae bacterium]|nr:SBBP repeat-containing protein [Polyangiaceae bacterium]